MPRFEITGPDGAKYQVEGPEGSTEQDALAHVQSQVAPSAARPPGRLPSAGEVQGLVAGKDRALRDLTDRPASWLAHGADYLGITSGEGARVDATNTAERQAYEQRHAADPSARLGRIGGQVALTLPIGGMLGRVAGAVGDVATTGISRAAPFAEPFVAATNRLLQGTLTAERPVANVAARTASLAASGAEQGATAAALTSGQSDEALLPQVQRGATIGAVVAPAAGLVAEGAAAAKQKLLYAAPNPEVQRLAGLAVNKYGIDLTADMISPSAAVQYAGSQLRQVPLSGMGPAYRKAVGQYTKAVGRTFGEDVQQITPAVGERAALRIGAGLDDVAAKSPSIGTDGLMNGLAQVERDASFLGPLQQPPIKSQIENVLKTIRADGTLSGEQYQSLTKFNSPLGKATRSADSDVRDAAIQIRHYLDDALEASLPPGSPLLPQLRELRLQYKNLKTVEPLIIRGEPGEISPGGLQQQVNRSFKGRGLRAEQPDLAELGDIGQRFNLKPDSGTATRAMIDAGLVGGGSVLTSLATGNPMNALYVAGPAAVGLGIGRAGGSILRSPAYINRLLQSEAVPSYVGQSLLANRAAPAAVVGYNARSR